MALAIVHMRSRQQIPVLSPWSAAEWAQQIDMRWADELPQSMQLVDEKGNQFVVPAFEIDYVALPCPDEDDEYGPGNPPPENK